MDLESISKPFFQFSGTYCYVYIFIECEILTALVMKSSLFRDITLCFSCLDCCLAHSIRKMEAICSSETPVDVQRNTRRYISEDRTVYF
jgi:hypothetical protein